MLGTVLTESIRAKEIGVLYDLKGGGEGGLADKMLSHGYLIEINHSYLSLNSDINRDSSVVKGSRGRGAARFLCDPGSI